MDKRVLLIAGVMVATLGIVGCSSQRHASVLQNTPYTETRTTAAAPAAERTIALAEARNLIGQDIEGSDGRTVGVLDDIVANRNDGKIAYGVVATGGFAGIGEKFHAVPWNTLALRSETGGKTLVANFTVDAIKNEPGFSKDSWPSAPTFMAQANIGRDNASVYGYSDDSMAAPMADRAYSENMNHALVANGDLVRISKLIGWDFRHGEGKVGDVNQAVVDMANSQVAYLAIVFGSTVDTLNNRVALIPWTALNFMPDRSEVALRKDISTDQLVAMSFKPSEVPDLSSPQFAQRTYSDFGAEPYWGAYGYGGEEMPAPGDTHVGVEDDSTGIYQGAKEDVKRGAGAVEEKGREVKGDVEREF